jgi:Cys-rich peptide (Clo7bot family)
MQFIIQPDNRFVEGYCYYCSTQCQNDCRTQCVTQR